MGFAAFVQCRGSNTINNEHLMKMFSICSLWEVKIRRCILMCVASFLSWIQYYVPQRATLLHSKLHAWIDKLDGRSMLTPKTSTFKNKTLTRMQTHPATANIANTNKVILWINRVNSTKKGQLSTRRTLRRMESTQNVLCLCWPGTHSGCYGDVHAEPITQRRRHW